MLSNLLVLRNLVVRLCHRVVYFYLIGLLSSVCEVLLVQVGVCIVTCLFDNVVSFISIRSDCCRAVVFLSFGGQTGVRGGPLLIQARVCRCHRFGKGEMNEQQQQLIKYKRTRTYVVWCLRSVLG